MERRSELIKCLICGLHKYNDEVQGDNLNKSESSLISKHLQVIFLLRNILEVPSSKLVIFLKSHPNLEAWLSVCDKCTEMVNNCKTTYQDILEAQSKFRSVKQEVIQVLKRSALIKKEINQDELDGYYDDKPLDIVEEIRGFVYQTRYPKNIDPFISGDHIAYQKLSRQIDKALEQLEEDDDNHSWADEDLHEEWIPSDEEQAGTSKPVKISLPTNKNEPRKKIKKLSKSSRAIQQKWVQGTFSCQLCPKTFPYQTYLDLHIKTIHDLASSATCDKCGASLPNSNTLLKHQSRCTGESVPCPVPGCNLKLTSQPALSNHLRNIHGSHALHNYRSSKAAAAPTSRAVQRGWTIGKFSCNLCSKIFPYQNYLDRHIKSIHDLSKTADCDICGATLPNGNTLVTHKSRCTGQSVPCPVPECTLKLTSQAALTNHLRNNHDPEVFEEYRKTCEFCGQMFAKSYSLKAHIQLMHEKRDTFKCDNCGVRKMSNADLLKHRESCKGESISCPVADCQMKFINYTALNKHVKTEHKDNLAEILPFKCTICEDYTGYLTEKQLKYHMSAKHATKKKGERFDESLGPFICETCGESYPNKGLMQRHRSSSVRCKRLRGEMKPEEEDVICEICGGTFKGKSCLGRHVQVVHHKRFTMTCEICGQGKNGKVRMEMHMWQRHKVGDERKWRCGVDGCTVQLFRGRDREDHMKRHRGEEPSYRCEECGKGFYMRVNIRQHVREVHEGRRCKRGNGGRGRREEEGDGVEDLV